MEVQKLFKANKRESAVDIVVNNIKHLLMERKLKPGDDYQVNPRFLREWVSAVVPSGKP